MAAGVGDLTVPATRTRRARPGARTSWAAAAVAALIVVKLLVGDYETQLLTQAFIFAVAAVSLDVVWGYMGAPDLGHALWFGIGALAVGMATTTLSSSGLVSGFHSDLGHYALGFAAGIGIAAIVAGFVGRLSFFASRGGTGLVGASQFYVAVVTLALTTAASTAYTQVNWTGGDNGLFGFSASSLSGTDWYFVTGALLLLCVLGAGLLMRSDFGLLVRSIRDNERRARYLAFNVEHTKTAVFMAGAAVAALAGSLYGLTVGIVSASLFGFVLATEMLVWVAVGGRGTVIGPVVGAIALVLIGNKLSEHFPSQWTLIEGALLVAVVVFIPDGAFPYLRRLVGRMGPARGQPAAPARRLVRDDSHPAHTPPGQPIITLRQVTFAYGELQVLRGVDLEVHTGELLCIVGPNGAGKSTLTEVLSDGTLPHGGQITFHHAGAPAHRRSAPHAIARSGVVRKFQIPSLFSTLTVAETLLLAVRGGRRPSLWRRTAEVAVPAPVLDIVHATGLEGRENVVAAELAHGLKQGLEIACAVASRPHVLVLDEPTAGLTAGERHVIGDVLRRLVAGGMSVILIEHDLDFVARVADRVAVLHGGRVIESGTPEEVNASPVVRNAYVGAVGA